MCCLLTTEHVTKFVTPLFSHLSFLKLHLRLFPFLYVCSLMRTSIFSPKIMFEIYYVYVIFSIPFPPQPHFYLYVFFRVGLTVIISSSIHYLLFFDLKCWKYRRKHEKFFKVWKFLWRERSRGKGLWFPRSVCYLFSGLRLFSLC